MLVLVELVRSRIIIEHIEKWVLSLLIKVTDIWIDKNRIGRRNVKSKLNTEFNAVKVEIKKLCKGNLELTSRPIIIKSWN